MIAFLRDHQGTLSFINDEATSIHGNIRLTSVYTSQSGEWRLGGFEVLSSVKDEDAILYVCFVSVLLSQQWLISERSQWEVLSLNRASTLPLK